MGVYLTYKLPFIQHKILVGTHRYFLNRNDFKTERNQI